MMSLLLLPDPPRPSVDLCVPPDSHKEEDANLRYFSDDSTADERLFLAELGFASDEEPMGTTFVAVAEFLR